MNDKRPLLKPTATDPLPLLPVPGLSLPLPTALIFPLFAAALPARPHARRLRLDKHFVPAQELAHSVHAHRPELRGVDLQAGAAVDVGRKDERGVGERCVGRAHWITVDV